MERLDFDIKVFDNFLEIIPKDGIMVNSSYEIRLKDLKSVDGKKELINETIIIHSKMVPAYASINAVISLLDGCYTNEETVMFNIREASKYANYLLKLDVKKEYDFVDSTQAFEVEQFVKYRAAYECTLKFYMDKVSNAGMKGMLGEVSFENPKSVPDISKLLGQFRSEMDKWNLAIQGHKEFRAVPRTGLKGYRNKSSNIEAKPRESFLQRGYVK